MDMARVLATGIATARLGAVTVSLTAGARQVASGGWKSWRRSSPNGLITPPDITVLRPSLTALRPDDTATPLLIRNGVIESTSNNAYLLLHGSPCFSNRSILESLITEVVQRDGWCPVDDQLAEELADDWSHCETMTAESGRKDETLWLVNWPDNR